jgi:cell wall-associated NlpC family hydrolase
MGWAIQAGAFRVLDNAVRLSDDLSERGLDATYFRDSDGLYKVRFGDFPNRDAARARADFLVSQRILEVYYLIAPESLPGSRIGDARALTGIRRSLVSTAESYLGVPYRWGGTSAQTGFDCSGLTQAVYKLNGLSIPRTSRDQFALGAAVSKSRLRGGDLLFFATRGSTINHVAIYVGDGVFIHAPSSGQVIRKDSLDSQTWSKQFKGARSYL